MLPARPGSKPRQHPDEVLIEALKEQFKHDVSMMVDYLTVNGRPLFHVRLTRDEELTRFRDPQTREEQLKQIEAREGPEAVGRYVSRMYRLMEQQEQHDIELWKSQQQSSSQEP